MRKILLVFTLLIILLISGCSEFQNLSGTNSQGSCELKAKELVPKYVKLNGNELEYIVWNDNTTTGCVEDKKYKVCYPTDTLNRDFNKGNKTGQNINYLYSSVANRNTNDQLVHTPFNKPITYSKKVIKNDVIMGTNSFEIDNVALKKVEVTNNVSKPEFKVIYKNQSIDSCFIQITKYPNYGDGKALGNINLNGPVSTCDYNINLIQNFIDDVENNYDNIKELRINKFVIPKADITEFINNLKLELEQFKENTKKYEDYNKLKEFAVDRYEVIDYNIINCSFVE